MFDWHDFFWSLIFFSVVLVIVGIISFGLYMLCESGNVWGFAVMVVGIVLGGSVAVGFGL